MENKNNTETDVPLDPAISREDHTLVLVLGDTGSGKSTFINHAMGHVVASVGHGMAPETVSISYYVANHPNDAGRRFILVDTLGFDAITWEDYDALKRLVKWLKKSYPTNIQTRLAIIYIVEIDQRLTQKNSRLMTPAALSMPGIAGNLAITTTKQNNLHRMELARRQEGTLAKTYGSKIRIQSFRDTQDSAWEIIDGFPGRRVNLTDVRRKLAKAVPAPKFRPTASITQLFTSLPGIGNLVGWTGNDTTNRVQPHLPSAKSLQQSGATGALSAPLTIESQEPSPKTNDAARLDEISARLTEALQDTAEYKRLLSCQESEAQALLDTFQLILNVGPTEDHVRRNLIVATKRLTSKTDLYPTSFILTDVWRPDSRPMASGGYADIHKGKYRGKDVCLKTIRVYQASVYEQFVKSIAREAILWGQLSHPNLLPFYGLYRFDEQSPPTSTRDYMCDYPNEHWISYQQLSLVSPWADNGNIHDFLEGNPTANRLFLCLDVAAGVEYLHENDIVHGDLKGANVLVDQSHRAYVADFGLSAIDDPDILAWASQSLPLSKGGTVRWQAPELLNFSPTAPSENDTGSQGYSGPQNTKSTDVYAWSCVCYEIFTSRLPFFEHSNIYYIARLVTEGTRPTRHEKYVDKYIAWGLTEKIWEVMNDCWKEDPADRTSIRAARSRLAAIQHEDDRAPREWTTSPAPNQSLANSVIPVTLEKLNEIISRAPISDDSPVAQP